MNKRWTHGALALLVLLGVAASSLTAYGAKDTGGSTTQSQKRASPKEQVIYTNLQDTYLGLKSHFEPDDGSDYYGVARIDVVDENGRATQAKLYVCRGSDSYTENFRKYLSALEAAYGDVGTSIEGYLDLWWDNRIRNWVSGNFYGMEQTTLTDPDGFVHEVTVVAVCGTEAFMKPDITLRERYLKGYGRIY